jgi:3'-5' exoribonuclease
MVDLVDVTEGDTVEAPLALREVREPRSFDGGHVLSLELGNATGTIPAKLWLGPDEDAVRDAHEQLSPGQVLAVRAPVREYEGQLELNLETMPDETDDWTPDELLPRVNAHVGFCLRRCLEAARSIEHPHLRRLVLHVWTDETTRRELARAPATKHRHRAALGGLVAHVAGEVALAETVCEVHDELDRDLLLAGVLLHDLGRLDAYEAETVIDLSREGRLLGTALLADDRLEAAIEACKVPEPVAVHVRHMAIAHAGKPEYGAPVRPATPEAIAVHAIERLDTRMARVLEHAAQRRDQGTPRGYSRELGRYFDARGLESTVEDEGGRDGPDPGHNGAGMAPDS